MSVTRQQQSEVSGTFLSLILTPIPFKFGKGVVGQMTTFSINQNLVFYEESSHTIIIIYVISHLRVGPRDNDYR